MYSLNTAHASPKFLDSLEGRLGPLTILFNRVGAEETLLYDSGVGVSSTQSHLLPAQSIRKLAGKLRGHINEDCPSVTIWQELLERVTFLWCPLGFHKGYLVCVP